MGSTFSLSAYTSAHAREMNVKKKTFLKLWLVLESPAGPVRTHISGVGTQVSDSACLEGALRIYFSNLSPGAVADTEFENH